jgi:potassium-transporting ATPase KdpC subunit
MNDMSFSVGHADATWTRLVRPVLISAVLFMLVTGLAYPLAVTGVAQLLFPAQANGNVVTQTNTIVGSTLIGQNFTRPDYFHSRPSATTAVDPVHPDQSIDSPYNAALSAASNLGPTSKKLIDQVDARARAYREENGLAADVPVPVDAVTASSSGLDPDISLANAQLQAGRVAHARGIDVHDVAVLITREQTPRQLGVLGEPRVNVLQLNLALDALAPRRRAAQ